VIRLKVWKVHVGRVDLLLLDADIPENRREDRLITYRLYGGSREDRIRQEVAAGIGGVRALRALGLSPGVWHLNEGHVAFLTLERLRELRSATKLSFEEAVEVVAADTVFTTHTPVPEGNEAFDLALARKYLARHAEAAGIQLEDYLALGLDRGAGGKPFLSMTVLALRLSRFRNGVSKLHGEVSRRMWSKLWPGFSAEDVPITSVTNGVHTRTWVAPRMDSLLKERVGRDWDRKLDDFAAWKRTSRIPERDLWEAKQASKREMVAFVREREAERLARLGVPAGRRRRASESLLDPDAFTIGFARRFALYKRAALLFRDLERARRIFGSRSRPVQIVFSGKPHPEDSQGKALFEQIAAIAGKPGLRGKVALVENYDIAVARHLVQGVDLWLNNPRRPLEASGTSGQKVPVNAGLNLSILDGWWCEGYSEHTGWAFGKTVEYGDLDQQDEEDAEALYRVLEKEVLPLYYRRNSSGMPRDWFRLVKRSMADLIPRFSTSHMVLEYSRRLYKPALENGRAVRAARAFVARDLTAWRKLVEKRWPFVHVRSATRSGSTAKAEVFLAGLDPAGIACRDDRGRDLDVRHLADVGHGVHRVAVRSSRGGMEAGARRTLRLYPTNPRLVSPVELGLSIAFEI
jgi:starch phosphorylase